MSADATQAGQAAGADADTVRPAEEEQAWPRPAYAWYVVVMLMLAYALATLDRVVIGLLVDSIQRDLQLSDTSMSLLIGLAFSLFYTLFGLPIGILVDRRRRVSILGWGIIVWSAATAACGLAKNFTGLFVARVFVGIGEATVTPSSSSIISDYFPPKSRARAFGVYMVGGAIGTSLAYLLGSFAISLSESLQASGGTFLGLRDWQLVFFLTGLPGIIVGIVMFLTVREPVRREGSKKVVEGEKRPLTEVFPVLRKRQLAYLALLGGTVMNLFLVYAQMSWYPTFFIRVHGLSPSEVGKVLAMVGLPAGIISALSAGWLVSWFTARGRSDGPLIVICAQTILWGGFGVTKVLVPTFELSVFFHFLTSLAANWGIPAMLMGISQVTQNQFRGQITAIFSLMSGLIAVTLGPLAVGVLSDNVFTERTGIAHSLAVVYGVGGLISLVLIASGWRAFVRAAEGKDAVAEEEAAAA